MHEHRSGSELKLAIWHQMHTYTKKYFERKNTIGWSEAGQLQMDQSPAAKQGQLDQKSRRKLIQNALKLLI